MSLKHWIDFYRIQVVSFIVNVHVSYESWVILKVTIFMRLFNCKEVETSPNFSLHAWSRNVDSQNNIIVCAWKFQNPNFH